MSHASAVPGEALALPADERGQIATDLLASLDPSPDGVAAAWADELERRAREVMRDPALGMDWDAARERIVACWIDRSTAAKNFILKVREEPKGRSTARKPRAGQT